MAYYSINKGHPVPQLPSRIRLEDGTTKTDLENYTEEELNAIGIVKVDSPPSYTEWYKTANWYEDKWKVEDIPEIEKNIKFNSKWSAIRQQRDTYIQNCSQLIEKYNSEIRRGVTPTINITKVDEYVEELRQIPQKQTDPFSIVWPTLDYKV
tara:strand:+ start:160 stop:615 length:456 start_codon:yes stop_codon:yes gene_type:complete